MSLVVILKISAALILAAGAAPATGVAISIQVEANIGLEME